METIMHQNPQNTGSQGNIAAYFSRATMPSQQETLGAIVVEILRSGRSLNRKSICMRLLARVDAATSQEEEHHLQELISLLFRD